MSLDLFGSTLRDEATPNSDLDLLIDDDAESRFDAFDGVGIELFLGSALDTPVDVTIGTGCALVYGPQSRARPAGLLMAPRAFRHALDNMVRALERIERAIPVSANRFGS